MGIITNFYLFEPPKYSFVIGGGSHIIMAEDLEDAKRLVKEMHDKASGFLKSIYKYEPVPFQEHAYKMMGINSKRSNEATVIVSQEMLSQLEEKFKELGQDVYVVGGQGKVGKSRIGNFVAAGTFDGYGVGELIEHRGRDVQERIKQMQKEQELMESESQIGLTKKEREAVLEPVRSDPKIQRNSPCPCGSGKKYKNCCIK